MTAPTRAQGTRSAATVRAGISLAEAVLGAGLIVIPPLVVALAGRLTPLAWALHLLGGALFSAVLGLLALRRTGAGSIATVIGAVFGDPGRRTVLGVYLCGFVVGQAAIALTAGGFLAAATGRDLRGAGAVAVLIVATAAATAGLRLGDRARRVRLILTIVLALIACLRPALYAAAHFTPTAHHFVAAVFLLFFAGVGWEASARIMPTLGSGAAVVRAVVTGAVVISAVYLTLALLLGTRLPPRTDLTAWTKTMALAIAVILTVYCVTNIAGASRFVAELGGPSGRWIVAATGAASTLVLGVALAAGWGVATLLIVPCTATWIAYLLADCCALRTVRGAGRWASAAVLAGLVVLPIAAVLAY